LGGEGNILIEKVREGRDIYMWGIPISSLHQTSAYYVVKIEIIRRLTCSTNIKNDGSLPLQKFMGKTS
jgi:hypothetical protein